MSKREKKAKRPAKRLRITGATVLGLLMGLGAIAGGIYGGMTSGIYDAYAGAGLGVCLIGLVLYMSWR